MQYGMTAFWRLGLATDPGTNSEIVTSLSSMNRRVANRRNVMFVGFVIVSVATEAAGATRLHDVVSSFVMATFSA